MIRADQAEGHKAMGTSTQIAGYYRGVTGLDDARSWGTGPLFVARPGVRMPVPINSTQYGNAGFNPTMGTPKTMGGLFDIIGDAVGAVAGIFTGRSRAREASKQRSHEEEMAEWGYRTAALEADTQRYAAELQLQADREKAAATQKMILIAGGLGIGALTLVMLIKKGK